MLYPVELRARCTERVSKASFDRERSKTSPRCHRLSLLPQGLTKNGEPELAENSILRDAPS